MYISRQNKIIIVLINRHRLPQSASNRKRIFIYLKKVYIAPKADKDERAHTSNGRQTIWRASHRRCATHHFGRAYYGVELKFIKSTSLDARSKKSIYVYLNQTLYSAPGDSVSLWWGPSCTHIYGTRVLAHVDRVLIATIPFPPTSYM